MIDLKQFCSTDRHREYLHNPINRGAYTYASNGHVLVRVPVHGDYADTEKVQNLERLFADFFRPEGMAEIEVDIPAPNTVLIACRECDGRGKEHECPDCTCECEFCEDGKVDKSAKHEVQIGAALFDAKYIRQMMALPGFRFCAAPIKDQAAPFIFDGGEGLVMPMRYGAGQPLIAKVKPSASLQMAL